MAASITMTVFANLNANGAGETALCHNGIRASPLRHRLLNCDAVAAVRFSTLRRQGPATFGDELAAVGCGIHGARGL